MGQLRNKKSDSIKRTFELFQFIPKWVLIERTLVSLLQWSRIFLIFWKGNHLVRYPGTHGREKHAFNYFLLIDKQLRDHDEAVSLYP